MTIKQWGSWVMVGHVLVFVPRKEIRYWGSGLIGEITCNISMWTWVWIPSTYRKEKKPDMATYMPITLWQWWVETGLLSSSYYPSSRFSKRTCHKMVLFVENDRAGPRSTINKHTRKICRAGQSYKYEHAVCGLAPIRGLCMSHMTSY